MEIPNDSGADCLIVGGGLSGLACAQMLAGSGHTVQVLEAGKDVGGRARTVMYQGEPVDRGFQTLFRAYRETKEFLSAIGVPPEALRPFERTVVVQDGSRWRRVGIGPSLARGFGPSGVRDAARLLAALGTGTLTPGRELDESESRESAGDWLNGLRLGATFHNTLVRPLLGSILLDRSLETDAAYVRFLLAMMVRGPATSPVDGMGLIAQRAGESVGRAGGMIWTDVQVASIDVTPGERRASGVTLTDGRRVTAKNIVLALDARALASLLEAHDPASVARLPTHELGSISAAFALDEPLYSGRSILLNSTSPDGQDRVDLVCQSTNAIRPGSPGPHIVIAQSATTGWSDTDPDRFVETVNRQMAKWAPRFPWSRVARPVDAVHIPNSQYRLSADVRRQLPGPRTALANVILAGDAVTHPSIEGAVSAGHRAARIVNELLP